MGGGCTRWGKGPGPQRGAGGQERWRGAERGPHLLASHRAAEEGLQPASRRGTWGLATQTVTLALTPGVCHLPPASWQPLRLVGLDGGIRLTTPSSSTSAETGHPASPVPKEGHLNGRPRPHGTAWRAHRLPVEHPAVPSQCQDRGRVTQRLARSLSSPTCGQPGGQTGPGTPCATQVAGQVDMEQNSHCSGAPSWGRAPLGAPS